jgi:hypothetical protein
LALGAHHVAEGARFIRVAIDNLGTTEPSSRLVRRRFSPVLDERGQAVPVLYAGEDLGCALGETVFHDIGDDPAIPAEIFRADLLTLRAGTVTVSRALALADLTDAALEGYGLSREQVVATPPGEYALTREWGQLAWDSTNFAGLAWNSGRSPHRLSYMLFVDPVDLADRPRAADRMGDLSVQDPPLPLADGPGLDAVMTAASAHNVTVVIS